MWLGYNLPFNIKMALNELKSFANKDGDRYVFDKDIGNVWLEFDEKLIKFLLLYFKNNPDYFGIDGIARYLYDKLKNLLETISKQYVTGYSTLSTLNYSITKTEEGFLVADIPNFNTVIPFTILDNKIFNPATNVVSILTNIINESGTWNFSLGNEIWFKKMNNFLVILSK